VLFVKRYALGGFVKPINIMAEVKLHSAPYSGTNNRKWTLGRMKLMHKVQSIPMFEKDEHGRNIKFLGYKYIKH
jgi:hypothetical protein